MPPALRAARAVIRRLPAGRYRLASAVAAWHRGVFIAQFPEELGGLVFECDLRDAIARDVCLTGHYEPQETALLRALLPPGGSFVDVGANWGYFTLLALHLVGRSGRVLALEPDPRCFARLLRNLRHNHAESTLAEHCAAVDFPGRFHLRAYDPAGGNFGVSRLVADGHGVDVADVRGERLDDLLGRHALREVDVLKMDVEGAEWLALRGAAEAIAARRIRALVVELHPEELRRQAVSVRDLFAPLETAGYTGYLIDHCAAVTRRAAYARDLSARSVLRPLTDDGLADHWPHVLWLRPGEPLPA